MPSLHLHGSNLWADHHQKFLHTQFLVLQKDELQKMCSSSFSFFFFPCQWCFLPPKNSTSARDTPRRGFPSSSWWTTHVPSTPRPVTKESIKMVCSQHSLHLFNSSERKNLFGRAFLCPTLPSSLLKTSANLGRPWWQGMFGHFHAGCTPELSTFERSHWRPNSLETWHIKVLCCQH